MRNLAGNNQADRFIKEELLLAGISPIQGERVAKEVPYSITGQLLEWSFQRAWYYWVASAPRGMGLPLEVAVQMHERKYPIVGEFLRYDNEAKIYGDSIIVAGDCICPHPNKLARYFDEFGRDVILDPTGSKEKQRDDLLGTEILTDAATEALKKLRYLPSLEGTTGIRAVIDSYHVDTQLGLNELARVIKEQHNYFNSLIPSIL